MPVFESPNINTNWHAGLKQCVNNSQPILGMHYLTNIVDDLEARVKELENKLASLEKPAQTSSKKVENPKLETQGATNA